MNKKPRLFLGLLASIFIFISDLGFAGEFNNENSSRVNFIKLSKDNYLPYLQVGGTNFFNVGPSSQALGADLFIPFWQSAKSHLVFSHLRVYDRTGKPFEGNVHLGYRHLSEENQHLYGVYGAFDRKKSTCGNYFNQLTFGAEIWLKNLFIGGNFYQPIGKTSKLSYFYNSKPIQKISYTSSRYEKAMGGVDAEVGYEFIEGLIGYVGGYYFSAKDAHSIYGPKARLSYDLSLDGEKKILGVFDKIGFEIGVQRDKPRGVVGYVSANLRIGLLPDRNSKLTGVARHMVDLVRRDVDIVSAITEENVVQDAQGELKRDASLEDSTMQDEEVEIDSGMQNNDADTEQGDIKEFEVGAVFENEEKERPPDDETKSVEVRVRNLVIEIEKTIEQAISEKKTIEDVMDKSKVAREAFKEEIDKIEEKLLIAKQLEVEQLKASKGSIEELVEKVAGERKATEELIDKARDERTATEEAIGNVKVEIEGIEELVEKVKGEILAVKEGEFERGEGEKIATEELIEQAERERIAAEGAAEKANTERIIVEEEAKKVTIEKDIVIEVAEKTELARAAVDAAAEAVKVDRALAEGAAEEAKTERIAAEEAASKARVDRVATEEAAAAIDEKIAAAEKAVEQLKEERIAAEKKAYFTNLGVKLGSNVEAFIQRAAEKSVNISNSITSVLKEAGKMSLEDIGELKNINPVVTLGVDPDSKVGDFIQNAAEKGVNISNSITSVLKEAGKMSLEDIGELKNINPVVTLGVDPDSKVGDFIQSTAEKSVNISNSITSVLKESGKMSLEDIGELKNINPVVTLGVDPDSKVGDFIQSTAEKSVSFSRQVKDGFFAFFKKADK